MSAASPTAFLLWSILASVFFCFLLVHLWLYDRFRCMRFWTATTQPGAFKRVMTYSYLLTVPILVFFSIAMTILKYREGWLLLPLEDRSPQGAQRRPGPMAMPINRQDIIPTPYLLWSPHSQAVAITMFFIFSIGWALEVVTHLEELSFWLFLLHQGPQQRDWFDSWEFRFWAGGSLAAVVGLPVTVASTKNDLENCFAWIFLVGSSASTFTTVLFFYVFVRFPGFLRRIKLGGADIQVLTTLTTLYKLNAIRIFFRFFYTIPLLVLAIDGLQGSHEIVKDQFWSDLLLIIGGIGCFSSSAITLLIFFPRPSATADTVDKPAPPLNHIGSHDLAWRQTNGLKGGRHMATEHSDSFATGSYKRARRASAPPLYTSQNEEQLEHRHPFGAHSQSERGHVRSWNDGASVVSSHGSWIGSRADSQSIDINSEGYGEGGIPLRPYITNPPSSFEIATTPTDHSPTPSVRHPHS